MKKNVTSEAMTYRTLWILRNFWNAGCLSDNNVVKYFLLLGKMASVKYPNKHEYSIEGALLNNPFWFADGIFIKCPVFCRRKKINLLRRNTYIKMFNRLSEET